MTEPPAPPSPWDRRDVAPDADPETDAGEDDDEYEPL
jgi:hypothetical protein